MITLQYPYAVPTVTLTLPNPRLGDADQWDLKTQINFSMTGQPYVYSRPIMLEKLVLTFNNLRDPDVAAIRVFIGGLTNQDIKYTDPIAALWKVRLITDPIQFTHLRDCQWSTTLELKGIPQ